MGFFDFLNKKNENEVFRYELTKEEAKSVNKAIEEADAEQVRAKAAQERFFERVKELPKVKTIIGYKAVTHDYRAFYGDQEYEIGKEYTFNGELVPCQRGFHFCRTLKDAMDLFPPQYGYKYLKVECDIPVEYYMNHNEEIREIEVNCARMIYNQMSLKYRATGSWTDFYGHSHSMAPTMTGCLNNGYDKKYITGRLKVLEEVPFEDYSKEALNELIKTKEDYEACITNNDYKVLLQNHVKEYCNGVFSDGFITYWLRRLYLNQQTTSNWHNSLNKALACFKDFQERFDAIKDEDISHDLKVMFMCDTFIERITFQK